MKHTSMAALLALTLFGTLLRAQSASQPLAGETNDETSVAATVQSPAISGSQVRIVRLSEVRGEVQLDRGTDRGFEAAFANLPITQGAKLRTAEGAAEVEFEDNSTLRLTPNSLVEFPRLGRNASGTTASNVNVVKGTVYASLTNTKGNDFSLSFGNSKAVLPPSSHVQLYVGAPATRLGVYEGNVQVDSPGGNTTVGKKKALLLDAAGSAPPTLVSGVEKSMYDPWDQSSVQYHKKVANASAYGNSSSLYGLSDLNYYGNFVSDAGCGGGSMWRPYFASAAWDPFSNGAYAYYPGAGYSFVSPYPWGWTPFHSGAWQYCPAFGWGWRPGGSFNGLANTALLNVPHAPSRPRLPLRPVAGGGTVVMVNSRPLAVSTLSAAHTFVFHNDSAGLGVPRQAFSNLGKTSMQVAQHGSVTADVSSQTGGGPSQAATSSRASGSAPSGQTNGQSQTTGRSSGMSNVSMSGSSGMSHGGSSGSSGGGSHH